MTIAIPDSVHRESSKSRPHPIGLDTDTEDAAWKGLFKVGSVAALIGGLVFRRNLGAEFMLLRSVGIINVGPTTPPVAVVDWFGLLQNNRLVGITLLGLFDIVNYALVGLMFLALFVALRRASRSFIAIAASLSFVGIVVYLASNQALTMLSLSDQYAAATTEAQRSILLVACKLNSAMNALSDWPDRDNVTYP